MWLSSLSLLFHTDPHPLPHINKATDTHKSLPVHLTRISCIQIAKQPVAHHHCHQCGHCALQRGQNERRGQRQEKVQETFYDQPTCFQNTGNPGGLACSLKSWAHWAETLHLKGNYTVRFGSNPLWPRGYIVYDTGSQGTCGTLTDHCQSSLTMLPSDCVSAGKTGSLLELRQSVEAHLCPVERVTVWVTVCATRGSLVCVCV